VKQFAGPSGIQAPSRGVEPQLAGTARILTALVGATLSAFSEAFLFERKYHLNLS
jgi:hypothetical protein